MAVKEKDNKAVNGVKEKANNVVNGIKEAAACAYDTVAHEFRGRKAKTNFPLPSEVHSPSQSIIIESSSAEAMNIHPPVELDLMCLLGVTSTATTVNGYQFFGYQPAMAVLPLDIKFLHCVSLIPKAAFLDGENDLRSLAEADSFGNFFPIIVSALVGEIEIESRHSKIERNSVGIGVKEEGKL
ncbi:unnamed protein product [Fraxinus pennsylvanica]|uniref:Uncharacterized protein n=1 Tax=Fraxinus pennsylvanica TaxID=56036 RepID=A0AAD2E0L0_9LAMI|nr:unnamed protein product [Fraxinus pennsylvanica]